MAQISGMVIEKFTKRPVVGASVTAGGNSTVTDNTGRFVLTVPQGRVNLQITHRDYRPFARGLNAKRQVNRIGLIILDSEIRAL